MTVISTAIDAAPIFLSNNFLNRDAQVTVTKGDPLKARAFDMTRSSKWVSLGSAAGVEETYDARLFKGTTQFIRSVDFIGVFGHNLRRFIVEYSATDGAPFTPFPNLDFTGVDETKTNSISSIASPVNINRIRVRATETQAGTGDDKQIGDLVIAKVTLQPARGLGVYKKRYEDNIKTVKMADGSLDYTQIFRSDNSFEFYRSSISFRAVSQAQRDLIRAIKESFDPFLFMPEPGNVPADIFICRIAPSSYDESYISMARSAGYEINMEIEEIGGG